MPFNLTILGSGSAVPIITRGVTAQYLNFNERHILIDCGEGTQLQLRKYKAKFQRIQYIFISHLHGDHFLGIFGLLSSMSLLGRVNKLIVFGPEGLEEIVRHQFKITKLYLGFDLEFRTVNCNEKELIMEDNVMEVYAFPLKHRVTCHGFLFKEKIKERRIIKSSIKEYKLTLPEILAAKRGQEIIRDGEQLPLDKVSSPPAKPLSYAYCTDTQYVEELMEWVEGADLLYHEATFTEEHRDRAKATGHSTASDAAKIAEGAKVEKLILGHFSSRFKDTQPIFEEASSVFSNVQCVEDGDQFIISRD